MYISLNPHYAVRNEASASFLIRVTDNTQGSNEGFSSFVIPRFMGYIFCHIGEYEKEESIIEIASKLEISEFAVSNFVKQLIGNSEKKRIHLSGSQSVVLPTNLLVETTFKPSPKTYEEPGFEALGDLVISRPTFPLSANIMVTTKCNTNCIYCYANRNLKPELSIKEIQAIISELREGGTVNLTLTGGDIFAMDGWPDILSHARKCGYFPFLSTKTPLSLESISIIKDLGYKELQFSLDSSDSQKLQRLISASPGYLNKVRTFFSDCSRAGIDISVRSVLTNQNSCLSDIESLYEFLIAYDNIQEWAMTPAFISEHTSLNHKVLEPSNENLIVAYNFSKRTDLALKIVLNKISEKGYSLKSSRNVDDFVCSNQICMANTSSLSILANGECSICEMLYDHPEFILGNIHEQSISEIWNGEKALSLYSMKQADLPNTSPCGHCRAFDECRNGYGKRICYLDISKSGKTKHFPDPRCPMADNFDAIF